MVKTTPKATQPNQELLQAVNDGDATRVAELLLVPGIDINIRDDGGATPLMNAAYKGYAQIVALLLPYLSAEQINSTEKRGKTALMVAAWAGHANIVALLMQHLTPEQIGIQDDEEGYTALSFMLASCKEYIEIVKMLVQHLTPTQLIAQDKYGFTALKWASLRDYKEIVEILLAHLPPEQKKAQSAIGLIEAAWNGSTKMVEMLLASGLTPEQINTQSVNGWTALMCAACRGNTKVVRMLLDEGLTTDHINTQNEDLGSTALDVAKTNEIKKIIQARLDVLAAK